MSTAKLSPSHYGKRSCDLHNRQLISSLNETQSEAYLAGFRRYDLGSVGVRASECMEHV